MLCLLITPKSLLSPEIKTADSEPFSSSKASLYLAAARLLTVTICALNEMVSGTDGTGIFTILTLVLLISKKVLPPANTSYLGV